MNKLVATNSQVRGILRRLRPPCARSVGLRFPYTFDQRVNPGLTVVFQDGEQAIASGSGTVLVAQTVAPFWAFSPDSPHATKNSYQVVIDHGYGVRTVVHGLSSVSVQVGQAVSRGEALGTPLTNEVFFAVLYQTNPYDPQSINRHFKTQDGNKVVGQGGRLRYAPDFSIRDLASGLSSVLLSGIRYFIAEKPDFLVNVDFNGNGQKVGQAAFGLSDSDYWNVYVPVAFYETEVVPYIGCTGVVFNINPVFYLQGYDGEMSTVRLERVPDLTAEAGTQTRFDAMLGTWVGGEDGAVPIENTFKIKGLPEGSYRFYLYAGQSSVTTDFYVSVNGGAPSSHTLTPTAATSFIENDNYVTVDLVLSNYDVLNVKGAGYWAGMQIRRI